MREERTANNRFGKKLANKTQHQHLRKGDFELIVSHSAKDLVEYADGNVQ
jgi:hypothetical protein